MKTGNLVVPAFLPLCSLADLSHIAREINKRVTSGDAAFLALLEKNGLDPVTATHTKLLELVARESGLVSYDIARKLLPEATETTIDMAHHLQEADRKAVVASRGRYRMLPVPLRPRPPEDGLVMQERLLLASASSIGYECSHLTVKQIELVNEAAGAVVYLDRTRRNTISVIVPPWLSMPELERIEGLEAPPSDRWYHNSNLRCFPRHHHRGKTQIPYGYAVLCDSPEAFARLLKTTI